MYDEDHTYTRILKDWTPFTPDKTFMDENFSTLKKTLPKTFSTTNAFVIQHRFKLPTHCSQLFPFFHSSSNRQNYFQGIFSPNDYSLDLQKLKQKQSQDPVLKTVYYCLSYQTKPELLTPQITCTPFLHAYFK